MKEDTRQDQELRCRSHFESLGKVYYASTPADFETIFISEEDFESGVTILGLCMKLFPELTLYTFSITSNRILLVIGGERARIDKMFKFFKTRLGKYLEESERFIARNRLELRTAMLADLESLRGAIIRVNEYAFKRRYDYTPFSYPWGADICFFNPQERNYYRLCRQKIKVTTARTVFHSRLSFDVRDLYMLDGYASPLSFCAISSAEQAFRNAKHYFDSIAGESDRSPLHAIPTVSVHYQ